MALPCSTTPPVNNGWSRTTSERCHPFALPTFTGFIATTGDSAPVLRIDTCTLPEAIRSGSSLGIGTTGSHVPNWSLIRDHAAFMPSAIQPINRHPLDFIPGQPSTPVSTLLVKLTTRHRRFTFVRLLESHLPRSCRDFSSTLTTTALYRRSTRWFETWPCSPIPRDLPSSPIQQGTRLPPDAVVAHEGRRFF
jgi:hypothetical protein